MKKSRRPSVQEQELVPVQVTDFSQQQQQQQQQQGQDESGDDPLDDNRRRGIGGNDWLHHSSTLQTLVGGGDDDGQSRSPECRTLMGDHLGDQDVSKPLDKPFDKPSEGKVPVLPPKRLRALSARQLGLLVVEILLVGAILVSVLKGTQLIAQSGFFLSVPSMSQDCGGYDVPSVERVFYINLQIVRNLSFSQAKLLDLAWDTVVGQGGRFLHGWVLYHVAAGALGWMMEYSAVPYDFQLQVLFRTVSLEALWSALRMVFSRGRQQPRRMTLSAAWLFLAVLYTLCFTSLWSAATGYVQPSAVAYRMPDASYATVDSDGLSVCWSPDGGRVDGALPEVVVGPRFGSCYSSFSSLDNPDGLMCSFVNDTSDAWRDLYLYAMTKYTMSSFYQGVQYLRSWSVNDTIDLNDLDPIAVGAYYAEFGLVMGVTLIDLDTLYGKVNGFEFVSNQSGQSNESYLLKLGSKLEAMPVTNATFQMDFSLVSNTSTQPTSIAAAFDPVPYNSTLRLSNGTAVALDAPFLATSAGCGSWMRELGSGLDLCVCYQGAPLAGDFRTGDALTCISEDGYVWGFAGALTLVGILLETCWIVGCAAVWLDAHLHSSLVRMNRPASGLVRSILDVAGAVGRDLGGDTGAYSDGELRAVLDGCAPVGYEVVVQKEADGDGGEGEGGDKIDRIRVSSVVAGPGRRRRKLMRLAPDRLYA